MTRESGSYARVVRNPKRSFWSIFLRNNLIALVLVGLGGYVLHDLGQWALNQEVDLLTNVVVMGLGYLMTVVPGVYGISTYQHAHSDG